MSDDLISRKALLDSMDKRYKEKIGIVQDNFAEGFAQMEKLIKEQQTAYDVDKVIEKLENLRDRFDLEDFHIRGILEKSIEIVKSGGVADD